MPVKKQKLDSSEINSEKQKLTLESDKTVTKPDLSNEHVKKGKKRKKKKQNEDRKVKMSEERLKAYGINPNRYKYMKTEEMFKFKSSNKE